MVSTWNSFLTKNLYRCHLFSIFPFFNGQPSMVSAVLFVSKDHTVVLLCDPNLTEELKDKTLKYIVHRIDDLIWSFYLITLFRPLEHLHTVGCIFEILTNTNTERQIQIQKGNDNTQLLSTKEDLKWSPSCLVYPHTPCLPVIIYIFNANDGKIMRKKHSNAFGNVSVWLLGTLKLPHNVLRHSSV